MVSTDQAAGRGIRARAQATIRRGGKQGTRGSLNLLLKRVSRPPVFLEEIGMNQEPSTLVVVENLIFGTRGSFHADIPPDRVAQWILMCLEIDAFPDPDTQPPRWGNTEYCDNESAAVAVMIGPNRVTVRYHAVSSREEAEKWFRENDHVRENGTLGPHSGIHEWRAAR